jgi:hypothetical protein
LQGISFKLSEAYHETLATLFEFDALSFVLSVVDINLTMRDALNGRS